MSRQDGSSVYGHLIAKQQPSLLAWTQMLDAMLGHKCIVNTIVQFVSILINYSTDNTLFLLTCTNISKTLLKKCIL